MFLQLRIRKKLQHVIPVHVQNVAQTVIKTIKMALGKAITFVKKIGSDKDLRALCNKSKSKAELLEKLGFDDVEFEDAINMQLVKCHTYEAAENIQQIKIWFSLL